jgi:Phasin protein
MAQVITRQANGAAHNFFLCLAGVGIALDVDRSEDGLGRSAKDIRMTDFAPIQEKLTAITTAHADYAKSAFEAHKAYLEKLATLKAPDQALQLTTDHMKTAYETFVAESQKIGEMYKSFFTTAFKPMTAAMTPALKVV